MKIYEIGSKEGYKNYVFEEETSLEEMQEIINTKELLSTWKQRALKINSNMKEADLAYNFIYGRSAVIVSDKFKRTVEQEFDLSRFEFLPVHCGTKEYFILHCIKAYDVEFEIRKVEKLVFKPFFNKKQMKDNNIEDTGIFKFIRNDNKVSHLYVTDKFIELCKKTKLDSVTFNCVWVSEEN